MIWLYRVSKIVVLVKIMVSKVKKRDIDEVIEEEEGLFDVMVEDLDEFDEWE